MLEELFLWTKIPEVNEDTGNHTTYVDVTKWI
jgi:hypothetical protein